MHGVITGRWGKILEKGGIKFSEVYTEYGSRLYTELSISTPRPFSEVVEEELRPSVQTLFDAITKLYFGSYRYDKFTWHSLEAQVGRPLNGKEKWLLGKLGNATDDFRVLADPNEEMLRVEIKDGAISDIKKQLGVLDHDV
jgi:hypothetical protein